MSGYLIYHPQRVVSCLGQVTVYHDAIGGNQDPYVWNRRFLHTYCHMTQMSPQVSDINFWVSGDTFPDFTALYCDLVFVVESKEYWAEANNIQQDDPKVNSVNAYKDHYQWAKMQHRFKRRRRFTLKSSATASFQPQDEHNRLLDIVPMLNALGFSLDQLQHGLRAGFNSKPMRLGDTAAELYRMLVEKASVRLYGEDLEALRQANPHLGS